ADDFEVPDRNLLRAHLSRHAHSGEHARWEAGRPNRTGGAVEHRAVALRAAAEMVALDKTGGTAAFADADHVNLVERLELIHQDAVALFQVVVAGAKLDLAQELHAVSARFLKMTRRRFGEFGGLGELHESKLYGIVSVRCRRLALHHHARSGFENRDGNHLAVRPEHLR